MLVIVLGKEGHEEHLLHHLTINKTLSPLKYTQILSNQNNHLEIKNIGSLELNFLLGLILFKFMKTQNYLRWRSSCCQSQLIGGLTMPHLDELREILIRRNLVSQVQAGEEKCLRKLKFLVLHHKIFLQLSLGRSSSLRM